AKQKCDRSFKKQNAKHQHNNCCHTKYAKRASSEEGIWYDFKESEFSITRLSVFLGYTV
ncbi:hypothetical protein F444_01546, partial [Phytophthora nicotianae P1976]